MSKSERKNDSATPALARRGQGPPLKPLDLEPAFIDGSVILMAKTQDQLLSKLMNRFDDPERNRCHQCSGRNGQNPSPNDSSGYTPFHS